MFNPFPAAHLLLIITYIYKMYFLTWAHNSLQLSVAESKLQSRPTVDQESAWKRINNGKKFQQHLSSFFTAPTRDIRPGVWKQYITTLSRLRQYNHVTFTRPWVLAGAVLYATKRSERVTWNLYLVKRQRHIRTKSNQKSKSDSLFKAHGNYVWRGLTKQWRWTKREGRRSGGRRSRSAK